MRSGKKAWVISVDMGYGHQRAAYPLRELAFDHIITANNDDIVPQKDKRRWRYLEMFYTSISRCKHIPYLGKYLFDFYDALQSISPLYPFRDLSKPSFAAHLIHRQITKKRFLESLVSYLKSKPLPVFSTFFMTALAADYGGIRNVYCVVTDSDINRVWVAKNPKISSMTYLVPSEHTRRRLLEYGVQPQNIILTGFPLPKENIGGPHKAVLKKDVARRLGRLDPHKKFVNVYKEVLRTQLSPNFREITRSQNEPITLTYCIGGAGAQADIGEQIIRSLQPKLADGSVKVNLVAGTHLDVVERYKKIVEATGTQNSVNVLFSMNKLELFKQFNACLRTTDVLWTKPSELSFYTGLGLPIIIAPPIGAHEEQNLQWLQHIGSGFVQEDPAYTKDWLFYWLEKGMLAEAAWRGFMNAPNTGTYNIEAIVKHTDLQ